MIARYGLKTLEFLLYGLALLAAYPLLETDEIRFGTPTDIVGVVFVLIGGGILLPRTIAYSRWEKVFARVGNHRDTWDGEHSATYSYEVEGQRYEGAYRSMYGGPSRTGLTICANPHAPWIKYPVFWNLWLCGTGYCGFGLFLLLSDVKLFG